MIRHWWRQFTVCRRLGHDWVRWYAGDLAELRRGCTHECLRCRATATLPGVEPCFDPRVQRTGTRSRRVTRD